MPDDTAPDTSNERQRFLVVLTGKETPAELGQKTKKMVQELGFLVVKEYGLDAPFLNDKDWFGDAIFLEFQQRLRIPGNATEQYQQNLLKSFSEALNSETGSVMTTVGLVKAGRAIINAIGETAMGLVKFAGDPVMMFNGQFTHSARDLHLSGAGMDFNFTRSYKNQSLYRGVLGYNWDHSYNLWLRVSGDEKTIVRSTGAVREDTYLRHETLEYWIPPDGDDNVILQDGSLFVARTANGTRFVYIPDPGGFPFLHVIDRIEDRFGNYLRFAYQDGRLNSVEVNHPKRLVQFAYDELGRIVAVSDFTGRTWQYTYDDFEDLVAVTTPATGHYPAGLTVSYEYSSAGFTGELQHNLTRIIDAKGQLYLENEYGTEVGVLGYNRVVRQRQGGGETLFEYEDVIQEFDFDYRDAERPAHQTNVVNRNGHIIHQIYNKAGNLLLKEEMLVHNGVPKLYRSHYRYNRDGNLVATMSPEGVIVQYLYGRDYFVRRHQIENEDDLGKVEAMTAGERQRFAHLLAVIGRQRYFTLQDLNLAKGVWGDIFPDMIAGIDLDEDGNSKDIILKYTYEDEFGQAKTSSDPRFTNSADPNAQDEHPRHLETLTEYFYDGPSAHPNLFLIEIRRPAPTLPDGTQDISITEEFKNDDGLPGYDEHGRVLRHVNAAGVATTFVYFPKDANDTREGYVQRVTVDPGGLDNSMVYEIDHLGRITAAHLPRAAEVADDRFITQTRYNELDQVVEITSSKPFQFKIRRLYDANGLLEREERDVKDENGNEILGGLEVHAFRYDEEFHLIEETIGDSTLSNRLSTHHLYDSAGKLVSTVLPEGNQIAYHYDERLLLIGRTTGAATDEAATTSTEYDADGRVVNRIDARGNRESFALDAFGRVISHQDALGHIVRRDYDKLGKMTVERAFEKRTDGYYLLTRNERKYDELGRAIRYSVNRFDEPVGPVQSEDLPIAFLIDSVPGSTSLVTQVFYDSQGRVKKIIDPLQRAYSYDEYDAFDRLLLETDALGNRIRHRYDAHGNLVRLDRIDMVRDPNNPGNVIDLRAFAHSFAYDELDRRISSMDSVGNVTRYFYDSRGKEIRRVDPLANVVRTEYDILGRRIADRREFTESGLGGSTVTDVATTRFEYDRNSNLVAIIDPLGRRTRYRYDALDRRRAIVYPDGTQFLSDYDPDGYLTRTTDNNGVQRHYAVDVLGRTQKVNVDSSGVIGIQVEGSTFEAYQYDGLGRRTLEENDFARREIAFDSLGLPMTDTVNFTASLAPLPSPLVVSRRYDEVGGLSEVTYPNGRRVRFVRDGLDRITSVQNVATGASYPGDAATTDAYDIVSHIEYAGLQRSQRVHGNGSRVEYTYDGIGRIIQIAHASPVQSLLTIQYLFDGANNVRVRHEAEPTAAISEKFSYDSLYRLVDQATGSSALFDPTQFVPPSAIDDPIPDRQADMHTLIGPLGLPPQSGRAYTYDSVGNRQTERLPDNTQAGYTANDLNQYTSRNGAAFLYDHNGNLKQDAEHRYVYDSLNRLVRIEESSGGISIARFFHDARGRRVLELRGGTATHLVWDVDNLIAEYRNGSPIALYVYEDGLDRPLHVAATGREYWYHADLTGSTRLLTDRDGNEAATYRYTPFGTLTHGPGGDLYNPLLFTGRRLDKDLATYDFRTRQYNPDLGRFQQFDPADIADGTNLYTYVGNNPLLFTDPRGTGRVESNRGVSTHVDDVLSEQKGTKLPPYAENSWEWENPPYERSWITHGPGFFNRAVNFLGSAISGGMGPRAQARYATLGPNQRKIKAIIDLGHGCAGCHITTQVWNSLGPEAINPENGLPYDWAINSEGYVRWVRTTSAARFFVENMTGIANTKFAIDATWSRAAASTVGSETKALRVLSEATEAEAYAPLNAEALGGERVWFVGPEGSSTTRGVRIRGNVITYDTAAPATRNQVSYDMRAIRNRLGLTREEFGGEWYTGTHGTPAGEFGATGQLQANWYYRERVEGRFTGWNVKNVADYDQFLLRSQQVTKPTVFNWCFSSSSFPLQ